ncbi:MAG TPA: hypothetical protein VHL79_06760 [Ramlibacter sp.]|nr:hypothetical protein [Ramlibacter sp.]
MTESQNQAAAVVHEPDPPQHLLGGLQVALLGAAAAGEQAAGLKSALERDGVVVTPVADDVRHVDADAFDAAVVFGGPPEALRAFLERLREVGKPVACGEETSIGTLRRLLAQRRRSGGATASDNISSSVGEGG